MAEVNNLLHTYAGKYLAEFDVNFSSAMNDPHRLESQISTLKGKEASFYSHFSNGKANDYKSFLQIIRGMLDPLKNSSDTEVFKRFSNTVLRTHLRKLMSQHISLYSEEISIKLDTSKFDPKANIGKALQELAPGSSRGGIVEVKNLKLNAKIVKQIARVSNNKLKKQGGIANAKEELTKMINNGQLIIFEIGGEQVDANSVSTNWSADVKNFPWGYTAKEIEQISKTESPSVLQSKLDKALEVIKNFVTKELGAGASPMLEQAITETWNVSLGVNNQLAFFSKGFENSVIGALGEFQSALLVNYLKITSQLQDGTSVKISADDTKKNLTTGKNTSEKKKTDVEVFRDNQSKWGIQVKNINQFISNEHKYGAMIGTNIHPDSFAEAVSKVNPAFNGIKEQFLTFVANYAFNETFATGKDQIFGSEKNLETGGRGRGAIIYEQFKQFAIQEAGALMNLQIHEELDDKVCFYVVGGTNLIPASMILEFVQKSAPTFMKTPTIIAKSVIRQTDSEFHRNESSVRKSKKKQKDGTEKEVETNLINYSTYWKGVFGDEASWTPTPDNSIADWISSKIRIDSGFRYKELLETTRMINL